MTAQCQCTIHHSLKCLIDTSRRAVLYFTAIVICMNHLFLYQNMRKCFIYKIIYFRIVIVFIAQKYVWPIKEQNKNNKATNKRERRPMVVYLLEFLALLIMHLQACQELGVGTTKAVITTLMMEQWFPKPSSI